MFSKVIVSIPSSKTGGENWGAEKLICVATGVTFTSKAFVVILPAGKVAHVVAMSQSFSQVIAPSGPYHTYACPK